MAAFGAPQKVVELAAFVGGGEKRGGSLKVLMKGKPKKWGPCWLCAHTTCSTLPKAISAEAEGSGAAILGYGAISGTLARFSPTTAQGGEPGTLAGDVLCWLIDWLIFQTFAAIVSADCTRERKRLAVYARFFNRGFSSLSSSLGVVWFALQQTMGERIGEKESG